MRGIRGIGHLLHGKETGPVGNELGSEYVPVSKFIEHYVTEYERVFHGKPSLYRGKEGARGFLLELAEDLRKQGSIGPISSGCLEVLYIASIEEPQYEARTTFAEKGKANSNMRTKFTQGELKALQV